MPLPSLRLECLSPEELEDDASWWAIYDASFPDAERETRKVILDSLRAGTGLAVRGCLGDRTAGLATAHLLLGPATVFLVYLAVAQDLRARNLGGALLEHVEGAGAACLVRRGLTPCGMVWEVDRLDRAVSPEEMHRCRRRIAFFERHGGVVLARPYFQPPLGDGEPVPMHLMFRPAAEKGLPDAAATEALVRAMYFEKYGAANGIPAEILGRLLGG
jgi:hypothetical protein